MVLAPVPHKAPVPYAGSSPLPSPDEASKLILEPCPWPYSWLPLSPLLGQAPVSNYFFPDRRIQRLRLSKRRRSLIPPFPPVSYGLALPVSLVWEMAPRAVPVPIHVPVQIPMTAPDQTLALAQAMVQVQVLVSVRASLWAEYLPKGFPYPALPPPRTRLPFPSPLRTHPCPRNPRSR